MICLKIYGLFSSNKTNGQDNKWWMSARRFRKGDYIKHKSQSLLTSSKLRWLLLLTSRKIKVAGSTGRNYEVCLVS